MAKIMISLPDELLRRADQRAREEQRSRSELFREALRRLLDESAARLSWREALAPLRAMEGNWRGSWDSTDVVRQDRDAGRGRRPRR
jgi:Arc/MetJ-type ribon-helix-helix transcriptional regulator